MTSGPTVTLPISLNPTERVLIPTLYACSNLPVDFSTLNVFLKLQIIIIACDLSAVRYSTVSSDLVFSQGLQAPEAGGTTGGYSYLLNIFFF